MSKYVLQEKRAEYGEKIVNALSSQLTAEFGQGFGHRSLFRMIQLAEFFPDVQIVSALSTQLGWSHFIELLSIPRVAGRGKATKKSSGRRKTPAKDTDQPELFET